MVLGLIIVCGGGIFLPFRGRYLFFIVSLMVVYDVYKL
jgi:hypothetical protein